MRAILQLLEVMVKKTSGAEAYLIVKTESEHGQHGVEDFLAVGSKGLLEFPGVANECLAGCCLVLENAKDKGRTNAINPKAVEI